MVQERPTTPEKQLLDLIEDPQEQDVTQRKIKQKSFSLFSLSVLRGRLAFFQENFLSGSRNVLLDIKSVNKVLQLFIALLVVYLLGNFGLSYSKIKQVPDFVTKSTRSSKAVPAVESSGKNLSYYLEGPRSRDIFKFGDLGVEKAEETDDETEVAPPVAEKVLSKAEILVRQLGLVGIGWSDDPDVMVEDTESKKIYFLKRGERIENLIKVEAIFEDRVILTYDNGEEMELR